MINDSFDKIMLRWQHFLQPNHDISQNHFVGFKTLVKKLVHGTFSALVRNIAAAMSTAAFTAVRGEEQQ